MAQDAGQVSRRELIKGLSGAALVGGQGTLKQKVDRPQVQRKQGWPDYKQAAAEAVRHSIRLWLIEARFADIRIMAVTATGGRLIGPDITPFIQNALTGVPSNIAAGFARAVGGAWKQWADSVTVPGLPWYPAFAAFPGPMAPPMPNIPMPVAALLSPGDIAFRPDTLASRLRAELGDAAKDPAADREIKDFANWVAANFATWKIMAQVMNVLGKGPIPTFAPPYVPVGPVVMGDNISAPGHLAASGGFSLPMINYFDQKDAFETTVGSAFKVKLESGAAGIKGPNTYLFGDVSLTPVGASQLKIIARGAELTLGQATRGTRNLFQKVQPPPVPAQTSPEDLKKAADQAAKAAQESAAAATLLNGSGKLDIQIGPHALSIPSAQFQIDPQGRIAIVGGTVDFKGVSHSVGRGSYISATEVKLVGWIPLINHVLSDSSLTFRPSGVSGSGRLLAFAHAFDLNYDLSGTALMASGEVGGPDRGWQSVPFTNGAHYQVSGARIRVEINGKALAARVRGGRLAVRSSAMKPDGSPWSSASTPIPPDLVVAVNGDVSLRPPGLLAPGDPLSAARAACEETARRTNSIPNVPDELKGVLRQKAIEARDAAVNALNRALEECRNRNPAPPPMPSIPQNMTVKVGNIVG